MGVLNATPDSFYEGSRAPEILPGLERAGALIEQGADVLDIGGESTRPGAPSVPLALELERVIPLIEAVRARWPAVPISIDTQKAEVARQAIARGANLVNDVSALRHDPEMAAVIADSGCGVILMHMQGTPQTMQQNPRYNNLMSDLKSFFEERLAAAVRQGIAEEKIAIDPGIGFGKTLEHNVEILRHLNELKVFGRPVLVGVSRKAFVGRLMAGENDVLPPPEKRLEGTLAATLFAVQQGAQAVRVHDVAATRQALAVWQALQGPKA
jgi:dihydropteroate synthase